MAHYKVTFSCGHTEEIQLFGKGADREGKIAYFEQSGICSECYKEKKQAEREAAEKAAAENVQGLELPALEGSEKQIAWAEKIRADIFKSDNFKSIREQLKSRNDENSHKIFAGVIGCKSAKFFIEARDVMQYEKPFLMLCKKYIATYMDKGN